MVMIQRSVRDGLEIKVNWRLEGESGRLPSK